MTRKRLYPNLPGGMLSKTTALASGIALSDCEVVTSNIADSAVTTAKVNDGGITFAKIQDITAQRLLGREDAIAGVAQEIAITAPLQFDTNSDALELADSGITNGFIADSAITTSKISDSQVTYAKIQSVTAQRLLGREDAVAGVVQEIAVTAPIQFDTNSDAIELADSGVTTGFIADSAITTAKINDGGVTTAKLGDTSVTTAKINAGAVTPIKDYDTDNQTRVVQVHISDTTLTVGDTFATFFIPAELNNFDLIRAEMCAKISSTTGNPTIQLRNVTDAADVLTTKITLDTGEKTSYTAATPSVVDTGNDSFVTGNEIAIDVDSAGTAEDVYVILSFRKP